MRSFYLLFFQIISLSCQIPAKRDVVTPWLIGFEKPKTNPVLIADSSFTFLDPVNDSLVFWQIADVFNPGAIVKDDTVFLLFRAEDNPDAILGRRTSRIGLAYSLNGIDFTKYPEPVFYPDTSKHRKWDYPGGVEDPRIVEDETGRYVMLYTSWNYKTARLSAATSYDLRTWKKEGPVFEDAYSGKYLDTWSKSGSIVTQLKESRLITRKINDKYWMFWGEDFVNVAHSKDLIDWTPVLDEKDDLLKVMTIREGKFDSKLTEPGPPALYTEKGILLLYNGKNADNENADPLLLRGTYSGGQALFDKEDPTRFITRLDTPFIRPDLPHEMTGQYKSGTTFIEGLVYFKSRWFLYYGTADSMVGVAIAPDNGSF